MNIIILYSVSQQIGIGFSSRNKEKAMGKIFQNYLEPHRVAKNIEVVFFLFVLCLYILYTK